MVSNFHLPPVGFGPGSQPEEGEELHYMQLPDGMRTYSTHLPEVEDATDLGPALAHVADRERNGPLDAVQIVVDTRAGKHDHRGGHAQQRELSRQVLLEHVLDELDRLLGILDVVEQVAVARRLDKRHGAGG